MLVKKYKNKNLNEHVKKSVQDDNESELNKKIYKLKTDNTSSSNSDNMKVDAKKYDEYYKEPEQSDNETEKSSDKHASSQESRNSIHSKKETRNSNQSENESENQTEKEYKNSDVKQIKLQHQDKKSNNELSKILQLYYQLSNELESELTRLKNERKRMKITYINKYLNLKSKLTIEENIKRQGLKKSLISNGDDIEHMKTKLQDLKTELINNINDVNFK